MHNAGSTSSLASSASGSSISSPPTYHTGVVPPQRPGKLRRLPTPPSSASLSLTLPTESLPPRTHSLTPRASISSTKSLGIRPLPTPPLSPSSSTILANPEPSPAPSLLSLPHDPSSIRQRTCRAQVSLPIISTTRLLPVPPSSSSAVAMQPAVSPLSPEAPSVEELRSKNLSKLRRHLGKSVPADLVIKPIACDDDSEGEDEGVQGDWVGEDDDDTYRYGRSAEETEMMRVAPATQKWKRSGGVTWAVKPTTPVSPPVFAVIGPDGQPLHEKPSHKSSSSFSTSASESSASLATMSSSSSSYAAHDSRPSVASGPGMWLQRKPLGGLLPKSPPSIDPLGIQLSPDGSDKERKVTSRLWMREVRGDRTVETDYEDIMKVLRSLH